MDSKDINAVLEEKRERLRLIRERRGQGGAGARQPSVAAATAADSNQPSPEVTSAAASPSSRLASVSPPPSTSSGIDYSKLNAGADIISRSKKPTLTLVKPEALRWSVAPSGAAPGYSKLTQTDHSGEIGGKSEQTSPGSPRTSDSVARNRALGGGQAKPAAAAAAAVQQTEDIEDSIPDQLSDDQRIKIVKSQGFADFFKSTSFIIERALAEKDVLPPGVADDSESVLMRGQGEPLVRMHVFNDSVLNKKITKMSPITSLDFNKCGQSEMFLASYFKRSEGQSALSDVEGQVCIWSIRVPQRPFQTLTAPSDVAKATYCKFKPNIVVGGLYNGQVCLWDTRAGSEPQQISPLTVEGHTYPVFGCEVVGSVNSHSLVSLSSDGKVCAWQLEKLHAPMEVSVIRQAGELSLHPTEIRATSLAFKDGDSNKFFLGSENGPLFCASRAANSQPEEFAGHSNPITAVHCHPSNGGTDEYSDLILTSSMDWTCKLWQPSKSKALFSFDEYTEYVYDVKWSPVHPAVFATVDASGCLSVWNILESMETPIGHVDVCPGKACTNLSWSEDGKSIIVGDTLGDVTLFEVSGNEANPKAADWNLLGQKLAEINQGIMAGF
eukprot:TRINITY_DN563_c1_g2_i2.p1 TRINITY_DN563_c1_g2~~TRINITY_DN563_c1_g2_i2.p1  ORF type:complete len:611 (+),score=124.11 TRINITY_DN563_c1_g2_i2:59-1891(+)